MNLSNENRLLLYCAQTEIPVVIRNKVEDLIKLPPLNWEEVLASASWYGITPLLYKNLNDICEGRFAPCEIMDKLRADYHGNLARNMYIYEELKRLLDAFHENGVDVIILKGAALAKIVYDDIGLRPMGDIDLMVKKEDLPYAEKIMLELGYIFKGNESPEWYRLNHKEICYVHSDKNIPVEIHWHISRKSHPTRINVYDTGIIKRWWEDAKSIEFLGSKVHILSPEDLIIHLCLHFLKHRFIMTRNGGFSSRGAFIQMCDVFQTLKYYKDEIDWELFKCKTEKYGIDIPIHTTLYIVEKFMGETDDTLHKVLNVFSTASLDNESLQLIEKKILIREDKLNVIPTHFIQSQATYGLKEKSETLRNHIFPNPESISKRYSISLSSKWLYLYYLIRPFSLLLKYGKIIFVIPRIKEDVILKRWISDKD